MSKMKKEKVVRHAAGDARERMKINHDETKRSKK